MQRGTGEWPLSHEQQPSMQGVEKGSPAAQQYPDVGVRALHLETLKVEGARATLAMTDAWVDPSTLGVRLIGESTLPLVHFSVRTICCRELTSRGCSGFE